MNMNLINIYLELNIKMIRVIRLILREKNHNGDSQQSFIKL